MRYVIIMYFVHVQLSPCKCIVQCSDIMHLHILFLFCLLCVAHGVLTTFTGKGYTVRYYDNATFCCLRVRMCNRVNIAYHSAVANVDNYCNTINSTRVRNACI